MDAPLGYLIVRHDVIRQTEDGAGAACWALQEANILDVADTLPAALRAAEAASRRTEAAVSILAVTVAGTLDATAPYDDDAYGACGRCESCAMLDVGSPAPAV